MPEGYERATGVNESTRQCMDCGKAYRAANGEETACPKCGSTRTRNIRDAAHAQATGRRRTVE